jgi:nucleotide-binding universal stress UspA family protein
MFLDILVGIDGSPSARLALDTAAELARVGNAKLTIIAVAPPVSSYVTLAGVDVGRMRSELDRWASELLEKATATLPDGVIAHTVQRAGEAGPEIVKELEQGKYDLLVLGSRGRGRAQSGLLGSVNGYVHFHTRIPLLTIPDYGEAVGLDGSAA